MKKVKVYVTLRESVLDPQGSAVYGCTSFDELQRSERCSYRKIFRASNRRNQIVI